MWFMVAVEEGQRIKGDQGYVLRTMTSLRQKLSNYEFAVTARVAEEWHDAEAELTAADDDAVLTADLARRINVVATHVHKTLYAEAEGKVAFFTTDTRYDTQRLLSNVGGLMRPGTFEALPELAGYDLAEAGICLAFDRSTAAAFHSLRGTESALRHLYSCVVRRNRMNEPWLWGPIITALRARSRPIDSVLIDNLDGLRRNFRNPTQHPEKVYEIEEAQDLFAACVDVLNRMVALPEWRQP